MKFTISRRRRFAIAALTASTALLGMSGCSGGLAGEDTSESLVVLNWSGYGSDLEWVTKEFEETTGAEVVHRYISSETELIELLRNGKGDIDVALPNFQFIGPAIREGLIMPLDESRLEHFGEVAPALAEDPAFRSDGELYGIPWVWGYSSVFTNTERIPESPTSVAALWDPQYRGKVALVDDATLNVLLASLYLGEDPADPDLERVEAALRELKANSALITQSSNELAKALATGTIDIGVFHSSNIAQFVAEDLPIELTLPQEGAIGWGDTWTIAADTKKEELAYEWINFVTSAEFEERWAADPEGGSPAPANASAIEALDAEARERVQADLGVLDRLTLQGPLPDEQLNEWVDVWERVKAS